MRTSTRLKTLLSGIAAAGTVFGGLCVCASEAQAGEGFDEGPHIWLAPVGVGVPVVTDDFFDLDPTFTWGLGGGWMFTPTRLFKVTLGGAFEHSLLRFEDSDFDFDEFGGHVLRFNLESRLGAGNEKVWGYGLIGAGAAGVLVHARNENILFDLDERRSAPGFNFQLGAGVQAIVWRGLYLGGEVDADLGLFFEKDDEGIGFNDDDDFSIHQVSIEFIIGYTF